MILRVMGDGQYKLAASLLDEINKMDNAAVVALTKENTKLFYQKYDALIEFVRKHGRKVPAKELVESDFILPPDDITLEEAKMFFKGEGIIPG